MIDRGNRDIMESFLENGADVCNYVRGSGSVFRTKQGRKDAVVIGRGHVVQIKKRAVFFA